MKTASDTFFTQVQDIMVLEKYGIGLEESTYIRLIAG
jgi:hypothetical protein